MSGDEQIRTLMTAVGMLMEDASAKVLLEPLGATRAGELRQLAGDLLHIADLVEIARKLPQ